jgi:tetratricopeptide (TPR) repeat protein
LLFPLTDEARASGVPPMQSDSACSAHVPGWLPPDYVKACAQLIARLKDITSRCGAIVSPPGVDREKADPQGLCATTSLARIGDQLAAAYNDRAYFLILCRGTENYRLAVADLDEAIKLLPRYWLAIRNRAVANMLLGRYAEARADFSNVAVAIAAGEAGDTLIRPIGEAEVRLGLGFAHLGLCAVGYAQEQLVEAERLTLGPIGADIWLRAASLYGQGLGLKLKGAAQARIAATNTAVTPAERGRLTRYAQTLNEQGAARMQAARALVRTIDADIRERFYIEEDVLVMKCRNNPASA